MGKKILVTGGTGYIGAHTVVELQNNDYEVIIVDNLANSDIKILGQIASITGEKPEFFRLDLRDKNAIAEILKIHPDIKGVIHFAASKSVSESVKKPLLYYDNNILALVNLLNALAGKPVNLVFSSSCTVYGEPDTLPVTELADIKKAESPYGNTKQIGEEILKETANAVKDLSVIALRYFNPVGAHPSALIGELPNGVPQNLVPYITQTAIGKREQLTVFGDQFDTPDGSCIRDFIHVVDLARAHVAAIRRMEAGQAHAAFEVFNIGTGQGYSVLELIRTFEKVTGTQLNYRIGPPRDGDIVKIWGDVSLAEKELGWRAENDLTSMLSSAWAWENYINNNPFN
ncbi:UDP-glucose 4-epimerase GalE [Mucilaginibacter gotjawali]|uniref:UDP-glucose 4-epimerase n=2 Tax=Mucilaginibacter gotjawali TaxID=1550579 RepID=A0A0X8X4L2_9SPHI|nr:UDP-glucose 4-epimerase GalE [Mucilaginibacter gotjawali]MBB3058329.1 UDP-glucose 4-epimerase [Mucilaginibacter gotjawali]BAU55551.1 UDP-glucose 4-epimerase [Mucilaginibacter gotjawali]